MRASVLIGSAIFATSFIAATAAAPAADTVIVHSDKTYVVPAGSRFRNPAFGGGEESPVTFDRPFVLTGILHFEGFPDAPTVILKPDPGVAARLPHMKDGGALDEIWFVNSSAVLAMALSPATLGALKDRRVDAANLRVALNVDRFTITSECGGGRYYVRFVSVRPPAPSPVAANIHPKEGC